MANKSVTLYYDSYEKNFGDCFYPLTTCSNGYEETVIQFRYSNGAWRQSSCDNIHGLDGNEKKLLLYILNKSGMML